MPRQGGGTGAKGAPAPSPGGYHLRTVSLHHLPNLDGDRPTDRPATAVPPPPATAPGRGGNSEGLQARAQQLTQLVESGRAWLSRLRLRALLVAVFFAAAGWAIIALTTLAWLPVVGVALAATAVSVNKVAGSLGRQTCIHCGHSLADVPATANGLPCPSCGGLTMIYQRPAPGSAKARSDDDWRHAATSALSDTGPDQPTDEHTSDAEGEPTARA